MATFLPADLKQPERTVQPENGRNFQLRELYKLLDCNNIAIINLPDGRIMVVDDEAKWTDNPMKNQRAMELVVFPSVGELRDYLAQLAKNGTEVFFLGDLPEDEDDPADYIAGDVLVCLNCEVR